MLHKCSFYSSEKPKKNVKLFSTLMFLEHQIIRVISEGSCDTEDWSNDAENSALITGIHYSLKGVMN